MKQHYLSIALVSVTVGAMGLVVENWILTGMFGVALIFLLLSLHDSKK